jgi:hypothetical protein
MAGWSREYNDQNQIIKETYFGTDNQPHEENNGVIVAIQDRDIKGNVIKMAYYQADEETLKPNNDGIAGWNSEYENGREIKREFFDEKEQRTQGNLYHAKWEASYDDMGNRTEISYFDKNGDFLFGYKDTYDTRGNLVEEFRFGQDKKLVQGYLIERMNYDERNNCIEKATYDLSDRLTRNRAGYAKVTYIFDGRNQELERRYYNEYGNLFINPVEGFAIIKIEYDNKGNEAKISYFDATETPLRRIKKGNYAYATQIREVDHLRRVVRVAHYDEQGNPTRVEDKLEDGAPPEILYEYDKWGNISYMAHGDGSGNISSNSSGYAIVRTEYDIRGNLLSESYYDKDDKPCVENGRIVHKVKWAYDKYNRQIEVSYYDINNKPCINKEDDLHKIETLFDMQGNEIETRYYDASVSLRRDDYAIEKNKYDEQDRLIERAWYDYLDRPFSYNNWQGHRYVRSYDESGALYDKHYTANNNVVAEWKYDPQTDEWARTDGWRVYFENSMYGLPITLNSYTRVTAITLSGNTCVVTLRINFSRYELSNEDMLALENEAKENAEYWWIDSDMPRNATMVVVGMDNAGRELYRVSY